MLKMIPVCFKRGSKHIELEYKRLRLIFEQHTVAITFEASFTLEHSRV